MDLKEIKGKKEIREEEEKEDQLVEEDHRELQVLPGLLDLLGIPRQGACGRRVPLSGRSGPFKGPRLAIRSGPQ